MEFLNKVELKGIVGRVHVQNIAGKEHAKLSMATNYAYADAEGNAVIETTWHNVTASNLPEGVDKGSKVHVIGRIRKRRYTDENGVEKYLDEIIASQIKVIEEEQQ